MNIFKYVLDLFFPECCLACTQRLVEQEKYLCITCLSEFPLTNYIYTRNNKLEELFAGRFPYEKIASYAFFMKEGILQPVIHELKYRNRPDLGLFLGGMLGKELEQSQFCDNIDILVPIPIHPKRHKERGYNQSLEIIKGIISHINLPFDDENLKRIVNNPSQTGLSKTERWNNVENIFEIADPSLFEDKHILLVDDIITTGSTLESCAKKILSCCPNSKISIISIGSTI